MVLLLTGCWAHPRPPTSTPVAEPKRAPRVTASAETFFAALRNQIPAGQAVVLATGAAHVPMFPMPADGDVPDPQAQPAARLADGRVVGFIETVNSGVGAAAPTWAKVTLDGRPGLVRNRALVTEDRLHRSHGATWAVFSAVSACYGEDEPCVADSWLLRLDGGPAQMGSARRRIAEDGPQINGVSWRPDGRAVAVGMDPPGAPLLHVIALDTLTSRLFDMPYLTAPAYGPDGSLYARGGRRTIDDAVYQLMPGGQARLLLDEPGTAFGTAPDHEPWETPPAPAPVTFDRQGRIIEALFYRKDHQLTLRVEPSGHVVSRKKQTNQ